MFTVERKRSLDVPAERVRALLADPAQLGVIMPRSARVEVLSQSDGRARVAVVVRMGPLGAQRVEGEARLLDDGLRFVAVTPMEIDVRWTIVPRAGGCEVVGRIATGLPKRLVPFARFVPQRMIEERIGAELDAALDAMAVAAAAPVL